MGGGDTRRLLVWVVLAALAAVAEAGFRDRIEARNKKICEGRSLNQFFRKETESNCGKVSASIIVVS